MKNQKVFGLNLHGQLHIYFSMSLVQIQSKMGLKTRFLSNVELMVYISAKAVYAH